jgi:photosystem II stability/assembly factor-like uncharacterized protein
MLAVAAASVLVVAGDTRASVPITDDGEDEDNGALDRLQAEEEWFARPSQQQLNELDQIRDAERRRWAALLPGGPTATRGRLQTDAKVGDVPAQPWVNVGPATALFERNGSNYVQFDAGRPNAILVDPRDSNVVYLGTALGGLWKSYDFLSGDPTWHPASDTTSNLAVGAAALDPNHPDTIYLGTGDAFDISTGGTVLKSFNGGGDWLAAVALKGNILGDGTLLRPSQIRDLRVAPNDSNVVLVASSLGLFRSTDGGASFTYVDLPNGTNRLVETTWSLAYLGASSWLVSGITACDVGLLPYSPSGLFPPSASCKLGTLGDIWRSDDAGATWTSLRNSPGAFPTLASTVDVGRIALAAGTPKSDPNSTVVYAQPSNDDITTIKQLGFWRSLDGGKTWKNATGTLANPTLGSQCRDLNVGHGQAWYNLAIAVDPSDDNRVIAGGNLCGVRTLNGTAASPVWENVAHWLPLSASGGTTAGMLPYVHADWHVARAVKLSNGQTRVFSGNDGGLYSSANVFDPATVPTKVAWSGHNKGLATHLMYSVGSGDPAWGNAAVVLTGLQDNGTFQRANLATPTMFSGVLGGDGIGAAINKGSVGEFRWISTPGGHDFSFVSGGGVLASLDPPVYFNSANPADPKNDGFPFMTPYSPLLTDKTGVGFLTVSNHYVWMTQLPLKADGVTYEDPYDKLAWQPVSQDFILEPDAQSQPKRHRVVTAAAARGADKLYGAVLTGPGTFSGVAVTADGGATAWKVSAPLPNALKATTLDFPLTSATPGQEFVVGSNSFSSASVGQLFKTSDGGQTWTSINGWLDPTTPGPSPLPNVPVFVVKYDPVAANTLYVGTLIGVYVTRDGGATWARFGAGLPFAEVRDMYIAGNLDFIRIATYGRGLWEIYPASSAPAGMRGDGDYDRNLQLDWVDLGAVASRLGTTPGATTPPMYSYICDVNGDTDGNGAPVSAIDDSDLSSVLGKFGDHP